jgi:hypothetical protein
VSEKVLIINRRKNPIGVESIVVGQALRLPAVCSLWQSRKLSGSPYKSDPAYDEFDAAIFLS